MFTRSFYSALFCCLSFCLFVAALTGFKSNTQYSQKPTMEVQKAFLHNLEILQQQAVALTNTIQLHGQNRATAAQVQQAFLAFKTAYKRTEFLIEYLNPELARKLNSGPIPKVIVQEQEYQTLGIHEPQVQTLPPVGLQVLEEVLFAEEGIDATSAFLLADRISGEISLFYNGTNNLAITDKQVLESLREQLVRVMAMGISGFDSPAGGHEMDLATASLEPVSDALKVYDQTATGKAKTYAGQAQHQVQQAMNYLQQNTDFDSFDRIYFIRQFADPAYAAVTALQWEIQPAYSSNSSLITPVNDRATSLFSQDFLLPAYYAKQDRGNSSTAIAELGKMLFFDPVLSSNNQRACASCHSPAKAFTDGQARSLAFDSQGHVNRNSPTLLNSVFSTAYFWDSRAGFLEDQIPFVVSRPEELHTSYEEVVPKLEQSAEYRKLFRKAFAGQPVKGLNANTINRAIAAYIRTLVALDSPFDRYMRHETEQLPDAAKRGFNLFTGKAACATCHFAPIFNGTVPPRFTESESEILGVPKTADLAHASLDTDLGRAGIIKSEALNNAFKTPTVRNVALTAPYMHNGAFNTLEEVLEFYNLGGGLGLKLNVLNQTLPPDALNLTTQEKQDLIAFMHSLTDTASVYEAPQRLPRFPAASGLNSRKTGGEY